MENPWQMDAWSDARVMHASTMTYPNEQILMEVVIDIWMKLTSFIAAAVISGCFPEDIGCCRDLFLDLLLLC